MRILASHRLLLGALLIGTIGCGDIDHRDYLEGRADAECKKYRSCAQGFYDSEFRDFDDCVDARRDYLDEIDDDRPKECDYDGKEGRRCVSRVNAMGCEEFAEEASGNACDLVWDCND